MIILNQNETATTEDLSLKIYELDKNNYAIYDKYCTWIGSYRTEKRAKKVIQEIITRYNNWENLKAGQPTGMCLPVYEMKKE